MVHIQLFLILMALWNFFFQSPDIVTSHIPQQRHKPQSMYFLLFLFSCCSLSSPRPSLVPPVSSHVLKSTTELTSGGCSAPCRSVWASYSSSRKLTPKTSETPTRLMAADGHIRGRGRVTAATHQLTRSKAFVGFGEIHGV